MAVLVAAAVAGLVGGAAVLLAWQEAPPSSRLLRPPPLPTRAVEAPAERVLLAWSPGGLPPGYAEAVASTSAVAGGRATAVRAGVVDLVASWDADGRLVDRPAPGWALPLEAIAVDPAPYAAVLATATRAAVAGLGPGEVLLGETSARLRRLGVGATLELRDGARRRVVGVVDDGAVGAAELALPLADAEAAGLATERLATERLATERYLLATYAGDRDAAEARLRAAAPTGVALRVRAAGETPFLRSGDAVLPQVLVKERFGEFAYRAAGTGRDVEQDPAWVAEHVVEATVPVLGRVRCHRAVLAPLEGALGELAAANLAPLVDPAAFQGCHVARLVAPGEGLSRHAWGVALDVNWAANRTGLSSAQDDRLVAVMERWGFAWGGRWLVPDPAHFEYLRPPRP